MKLYCNEDNMTIFPVYNSASAIPVGRMSFLIENKDEVAYSYGFDVAKTPQAEAEAKFKAYLETL
jgi:hypothetical protein